jgi:TPR repeat protein
MKNGRIIPPAFLLLATFLSTVPLAHADPPARPDIKTLQTKANAGDPEAMFYLGARYIGGIDVPVDLAKARTWYEKAAAAGNPLAMDQLGDSYAHGYNGVARDYQKSFTWYQKEAALAAPWGLIAMGKACADGRGLPKDMDKANDYFHRARDAAMSLANAGDADAMDALAYINANAYGVEQNDAEALRWASKSADLGYTDAMIALGDIYTVGHGVPPDIGKGVSWFMKAATAGDAAAMMRVGEYWGGWSDSGQSHYAVALEWLRKSADRGNCDAMRDIGYLYENGMGVPEDDAEALKWYTKAADLGEPFAMESIGDLYHNAKGVPLDNAKALDWYKKSATENPSAMFKIGALYD